MQTAITLKMFRYTNIDAREGSEFESITLCEECSDFGRVSIERNFPAGDERVEIALDWLEDYSYSAGYDETCKACGYSPADIEEEDDDTDYI